MTHWEYWVINRPDKLVSAYSCPRVGEAHTLADAALKAAEALNVAAEAQGLPRSYEVLPLSFAV